ncbi:MAG: hypothetical protein P4M04_06650 [Acidobacteriota bacterium]|nr:hypothetical protein [Acidobacteriota bacterium]
MQVLAAGAYGHISPKLMGLMLYGLQIASTNLRLGVNFQAAGEDLDAAPEMCSAYDTFEEDYEITANGAGLRRSAADHQADEQERARAKLAAQAAIEKKVPAAWRSRATMSISARCYGTRRNRCTRTSGAT